MAILPVPFLVWFDFFPRLIDEGTKDFAELHNPRLNRNQTIANSAWATATD